MVVRLQYSVFDYRFLNGNDTIQPLIEQWPYVLDGHNFMPNVGIVLREKSYSLREYMVDDDVLYVKANNIMKFEPFTSGNNYQYSPIYRRFKFSKEEGYTLTIGFEIRNYNRVEWDIEKLRNLLHVIFSRKVKFKMKGNNDINTTLTGLPDVLKKSFYNYMSKDTDITNFQHSIANIPYVTIILPKKESKDSLFFNTKIGNKLIDTVLLHTHISTPRCVKTRGKAYFFNKISQLVANSESLARLIKSNRISIDEETFFSALNKKLDKINNLMIKHEFSQVEGEFLNGFNKRLSTVEKIFTSNFNITRNVNIHNFDELDVSIQSGEPQVIIKTLKKQLLKVDKEEKCFIQLTIFRLNHLDSLLKNELINSEQLIVRTNEIVYNLLESDH